MKYEVRLRPAAQKELDDLAEQDYRKISGIINTLSEDPRPPRVKKLAESGLWRVRVGQFRVVYSADDKALLVTIVRVVRRREDSYRGL
ncbi:MAG: type II toxin-antitoxin system RelE/ParE family toxin [Chloroflexi bacterium]|nr:type II toxin-antitoxin system RelE/ParE family toxin [Chloroflexota bacterium]